jgi:hypothetical protein
MMFTGFWAVRQSVELSITEVNDAYILLFQNSPLLVYLFSRPLSTLDATVVNDLECPISLCFRFIVLLSEVSSTVWTFFEHGSVDSATIYNN